MGVQSQPYQEPTFRAANKGKDNSLSPPISGLLTMVGKSDALITSVRLSAIASTNRAAEPAVFIFKPDDRRVTLQSFVNLSAELDIIEVVANLHPCLSNREFKLNFYHTPPVGEPRKLAYERMSTSSRVVYRLKIPHSGINTVGVTVIIKSDHPPDGVDGVAVAIGGQSWELERSIISISPILRHVPKPIVAKIRLETLTDHLWNIHRSTHPNARG
jgi:hypothetical protein